MKTTIFELLRMIKDGKAPKKIYFDKLIWKYEEFEGLNSDGTTFVSKDYKNIETGDGLFDLYIITDILNDEVEILEITITYKQDADYLKPQEPTPYEPYTPPIKQDDNIEKVGSIINQTIKKVIPFDELEKNNKIEKLKIVSKKTECGHNHHYLVNDKIEYRLREADKIILDKINELIDRYNNER